MTILFTALSSDERPAVGSCGCHGTAPGHIARRYKPPRSVGMALLQCRVCTAWWLRPWSGAYAVVAAFKGCRPMGNMRTHRAIHFRRPQGESRTRPPARTRASHTRLTHTASHSTHGQGMTWVAYARRSHHQRL